MKTNHAMAKRLRERSKREKQAEKALRKAARKAAKDDDPAAAASEPEADPAGTDESTEPRAPSDGSA